MLQAFSRFFRAAAKSCYDMEFYRELRQRQKPRAFWYLAGIVAIFIAVHTAMLVPALSYAKQAATTAIHTRLPDNARIGISHGRLETNLSTPFSFGSQDPVVLIDTSIQGAEKYERDDLPEKAVVFGRDALFFTDRSGRQRITPYADLPDFSVTKERILAELDGFGSASTLGLALVIGIVWFLLFLLGLTVYAAAAALAGLGIGRVAKARLGYGQWFTVACHALTLPLATALILGPLFAHIPFAWSVLFLMIMVSVVIDERSNPTAAAEPAPKTDAAA